VIGASVFRFAAAIPFTDSDFGNSNGSRRWRSPPARYNHGCFVRRPLPVGVSPPLSVFNRDDTIVTGTFTQRADFGGTIVATGNGATAYLARLNTDVNASGPNRLAVQETRVRRRSPRTIWETFTLWHPSNRAPAPPSAVAGTSIGPRLKHSCVHYHGGLANASVDYDTDNMRNKRCPISVKLDRCHNE
jgi:hypothetical protein